MNGKSKNPILIMRKEFIALLKEAYGVATKDGYNFDFKEKNLTQKEVAEELGYDNGQFGKILKPSYTGYYKDISARLKYKIKKDNAAKQLEIDFRKKIERQKRKHLIFSFLSGLLLGCFLFSVFLFSNLYNPTKNQLGNKKNNKIHVTSKPNINYIKDPSFEENGNEVYAENWRKNELGPPIQLTTKPVFHGKTAGKLPASGDRFGYQEVIVSENTNYILSFYYFFDNSSEGSLTLSVLRGQQNNIDELKGNTIKSITLDNQFKTDTYRKAYLEFNSGNNSIISIYFTNEGVLCKIDAFDLNINQ